jgi:hypothetical protein
MVANMSKVIHRRAFLLETVLATSSGECLRRMRVGIDVGHPSFSDLPWQYLDIHLHLPRYQGTLKFTQKKHRWSLIWLAEYTLLGTSRFTLRFV